MKNYLPKFNNIPVHWGKSTDLITILDTNVLSYLLIQDVQKQIEFYFRNSRIVAELLKFNDYTAISSISIYEVLQSNEIKKYIDLLNKFYCFDVSNDVLYTSTQISKLYKSKGISMLDLPDLIISATAYLNSSSILTANQHDFKSCLFRESLSFYISWVENERTKGVTLYLLRPDYKKTPREILLPDMFN